jgi:hypothetical protein
MRFLTLRFLILRFLTPPYLILLYFTLLFLTLLFTLVWIPRTAVYSVHRNQKMAMYCHWPCPYCFEDQKSPEGLKNHLSVAKVFTIIRL